MAVPTAHSNSTSSTSAATHPVVRARAAANSAATPIEVGVIHFTRAVLNSRANSKPATSAPTPGAEYSNPTRRSFSGMPSCSTAYGTSRPSMAPNPTELPKPVPSNVATLRWLRTNRYAREICARIASGPDGTGPTLKVDRIEPCTTAAKKNVQLSNHTAFVGPTVAARSPPRAGPAISAAETTAARKPLAAARRSVPTSAGTAPKTAASENTNAVADSRPTAYTCATVRTPKSAAIGIVA